MFDRIFSQSSGRVVASARLSLATLFLIATIGAPGISPPAPIEFVLAAYVGFAAVVAWLVWNDWWVDARTAVAAHLIDIGFFTIVVLWPEGYASPYFLFFIFLLLSAAIRWGWRATSLTAAAVIPLYLVAGLLITRPTQADFELQRFIIRSGYLVVLSAILIWFGLHRRFSTGALLADGSVEFDADADSPFHSALRHAQHVLKARCGVALWTHPNGDQLALCAEGGDIRRLTLPPGPAIASAEHAFLFSVARNRALLDPEAPRPRFRRASGIDHRILDHVQSSDGLAIPVHGHLGNGLFVFWSIDGLHSDHLELGVHLSHRLAQLIERGALISARQEGAIARERMSLARDLHDGIVQFLAGSTYRIEAISRSIGGGDSDAAADLQDLKELMLLEQEDLRTSIAALRADHVRFSQVASDARALCGRLGRHWQLDCSFETSVPDVVVSARLHLDMLQIIREAVANAARHSSARKVAVRVENADQSVVLTIANDGVPQRDWPEAGPWSIRERIEQVGGAISMSSDRRGTTLTLQLPTARERL